MFAGYCVGHFNHRYFVLFLAWMWLGVLYCTWLNSLYVWTGKHCTSFSSLNRPLFVRTAVSNTGLAMIRLYIDLV